MSDLQISLIFIGLLVVAGVYLFNRLQERRYRRRMERAFDSEQREDVLLAPNPPDASAPEVRAEARIEPSLAEAPEAFPAEAFPASRAAAVPGSEGPSAGEAPREPLGGDSRVPADPQAPMVDYCAHLAGNGLLAATALRELAANLRGIGKPVRLETRDAPDSAWAPLALHDSDVSGPLRIAVPLADRTGALSQAQLVRFREVVQKAADELGATATFGDTAGALEAAADLDAFCADNDVAIGLNIVPRGVVGLVGTKLRALAEASGFTLAADGSFHLHDDRGATTIVLASMDGVPFESSSLKMLRSQGISLVLDVPRVAEGRQVFRRMTELARNFAASLDGVVVDDRRAPLTDTNLERIAVQIDSIQSALTARGIAPGGPLALRLFS